jgi:hypothetical protein
MQSTIFEEEENSKTTHKKDLGKKYTSLSLQQKVEALDLFLIRQRALDARYERRRSMKD